LSADQTQNRKLFGEGGGFGERTREWGKHRTEVTEVTEGGWELMAESFLGKAVASVAMSTRRSYLSRCCVSNKPATALGTPNLTCPQQMLIARHPDGRLLLLSEGGQGDVLTARTGRRHRDSGKRLSLVAAVDMVGLIFVLGIFPQIGVDFLRR
jgi:hypothetical protein